MFVFPRLEQQGALLAKNVHRILHVFVSLCGVFGANIFASYFICFDLYLRRKTEFYIVAIIWNKMRNVFRLSAFFVNKFVLFNNVVDFRLVMFCLFMILVRIGQKHENSMLD